MSLGLGLGLGIGRGLVNTSIMDSTPEVVDVIILVGQSNNDGRAGINEARPSLVNYFATNPTNKYIWFKEAARDNLLSGATGTQSFVNNGQINYINLNANTATKRTTQVIGIGTAGTTATSAVTYGPECELAYNHYLAYPNKKLVIIKGAVGSSAIAQWDFSGKASGTLWKWFLDIIHNPAVAYLQSKNKTLNLIGLTWVQGEADANATDAPNYQTKLTQALAAFKSDLFAVPRSIIIQGLGTSFISDPNAATIKTAQLAVVATDRNTFYQPADGTGSSPAYGLKTDNLHFNGAGLYQMGADSWAYINNFRPSFFGNNLVINYRPSDTTSLTSSAGLVSQMSDISANARNATQATGSLQPATGTRTINSLNAIDFDGTDDYMTVPSGQITFSGKLVAAAFIADNTDQTSLLFANNGAGGGTKTRFYFKNQAIDFGDATLSRVTPATGNTIQIGRVLGTATTTQKLKINNEAELSGAVTRNGVSATTAVGNFGTGTGFPFNGALSELVVADDVTDAAVDNIGTYFYRKYGIPFTKLDGTVPDSSSFTISDLSADILMWHDATNAAKVTASGGFASALIDDSANGYTASQATAGNKPSYAARTLNSLNGLGFDGVDDFMSYSSITLPDVPIAICTVFIPDSTDNTQILFGNSGNGTAKTRVFEKNQAVDFGGTILAKTTPTSGAALIQMCWVDGMGATTQYLKINNDLLLSGAVTHNTPNTVYRLGSYGSGGSNAAHAFFERVIIKNPTPDKLNKIGRFFSKKYGIVWGDV